ncbi:hypothetical protein LMIY3S_03488 [Labrys miyagiensis]
MRLSLNRPVELCSYPGLDDRISIVRVENEVDAVFVRTRRFNVLVDTLGTPEQCRMALDLLGIEASSLPLIVVNSHMDWDHFWGNAAIAGRAPILAHASALERLRDPAAQRTLREKASQDPRFRDVELVSPTVTFAGPAVLDGGDLTLELFHTPGHTPDHLAIWIRELRTCLAVDAVEHPIPEVWSRSSKDLRLLRESLGKICGLDADIVIPAHGNTSSPSTVRENLAYFDTLAERVESLAPGQLTDPDLCHAKGYRLQDFVSVPTSLPAELVGFYEECHRTNLGATVQAQIEKQK